VMLGDTNSLSDEHGWTLQVEREKGDVAPFYSDCLSASTAYINVVNMYCGWVTSGGRGTGDNKQTVSVLLGLQGELTMIDIPNPSLLAYCSFLKTGLPV
jgi:hypothetical protein